MNVSRVVQTASKGEAKTPSGNGRPESRSELSARLDSSSISKPVLWGCAFAAVFIWAYWTTFAELVTRWATVADYSHGFLVIPLAFVFMWVRRAEFPTQFSAMPGLGLAVIAAATLVRYLSARMFLPAFDGWSIPFWLGGVCLWFGGARLLRFCFPSLLFLLFMVPLPYRMESALGIPLRNVAAKLGSWTLQCLQQPAVQDGTTILMNEREFDVAPACSGLRMMMGIVALATAYITLSRKPWWQKLALFLCAFPIAVLANVVRITATALLYEHVSTESAKAFSHDAAGWVTNCAAAGFFGIVIWCLGRMFTQVEIIHGPSLAGLNRPAAN